MKNLKWAIEVNGPANIVMMVQRAKHRAELPEQKDDIDLLDQIERQARMTIAYLRCIQNKDPKFWHEIQYVEVDNHGK
jgi:hypothetical protein